MKKKNPKTDEDIMLEILLQELGEISRRIDNLEKLATRQVLGSAELARLESSLPEFFVDVNRWANSNQS
jgi:NTP pyrophosphatase (non-canonical NTP hydrolase)